MGVGSTGPLPEAPPSIRRTPGPPTRGDVIGTRVRGRVNGPDHGPRTADMAPLPASPHVETPAGAGSDSDALWDLLRDCHRRIRAELRAVVARHGIHLGEYRVLNR